MIKCVFHKPRGEAPCLQNATLTQAQTPVVGTSLVQPEACQPFRADPVDLEVLHYARMTASLAEEPSREMVTQGPCCMDTSRDPRGSCSLSGQYGVVRGHPLSLGDHSLFLAHTHVWS